MRRTLFELRYLFGRAPWDTGISPPELLAFLGSNPAGRALDLGCGTGTNVVTLARRGWDVTGIDFSTRAISAARARARASSVSADLRCGDVSDLAMIEGPFDLILDIGCFHRLGSAAQARYAGNMDRLLGRRGVFLLYAFVADPTAPSGFLSVDQTAARFAPQLAVQGVELGKDRRYAAAWFTFGRPA
jgi:cyclopropane fatty-acyl-phospholipid synthase-like methyltransferase